ncbi:MAG: AAA family ATPase [Polyangiaceae bacterium]|nr:AAA family ATPase [Polyangiaceae bacterium]
MSAFIPGIGESDFRNFREAGFGYVDKSFFISDMLADPALALRFPRPRRFGKTINLSMLRYFLGKSKEDLSHLFEGLAVTRDAKAMQHFQRHPVISVSFKDVKADTLSGTMAGIHAQLMTALIEHRYLLDDPRIDPTLARLIRRVLDGEVTHDELPYVFQWLSQALHAHHGERVVILIDEYDTPVQSGYMYDFFDKIVLFFRSFFSACLKDNPALFKGVLTGILRVSKENMFSGLNHIMAYSIIDTNYSTVFGFTEDEVAAIIPPERLQDVRDWYNGYIFGGHVIYNPWSILNYIREGLLKPYWVNSGSSDLIDYLAAKLGLGLTKVSEALLQGEAIDMPIDSNIALRDIDKNEDALWNFLLFAGYLKPVQFELVAGRYYGKLAIPNREVKLVFEDMFRNWLYKAAPSRDYIDDLVQAIFAGDAETIQEILEDMFLRILSYQDAAGRQPEKLYHGLILGLLVHLENEYDVRSNRESGRGRADVLIRPKTPGNPGVVMEFKVLRRSETPEQALVHAAKQVRDRKYAEDVRASGASVVHEYAMVFDGKRAWVRKVEALLDAAP